MSALEDKVGPYRAGTGAAVRTAALMAHVRCDVLACTHVSCHGFGAAFIVPPCFSRMDLSFARRKTPQKHIHCQHELAF